jgi:hypothetical protein
MITQEDSNFEELQKSNEYLDTKRAKLLEKHPQGGFVVVKNEEILGVWPERSIALQKGLEVYGNVLFLVTNLQKEDVSHVNYSFNAIS